MDKSIVSPFLTHGVVHKRMPNIDNLSGRILNLEKNELNIPSFKTIYFKKIFWIISIIFSFISFQIIFFIILYFLLYFSVGLLLYKIVIKINK